MEVKPISMRRTTQASRAVRTLVANPLSILGFVILLIMVVAAAWPVAWLPHDPYTTRLLMRFTPPSWLAGGTPEYQLGTDALGRDMLSMIIHGARYSLTIVFLATALSVVVGTTAGLLAGFYRGWVGTVVMRLTDVQLAFPVMVLLIAMVAVLGAGLGKLIVVLGFAGWAPYSRVVRGTVLSLREKEYVDAARATGAGDFRIITKHLLPNTVTPLIIYTTFELARLLLLESALSFLGLGVQPPAPSWGAMIADGRQYLFDSWWASALPGLAIVMTVLAFNLLGDGLRDALDPLGRTECG